MELALALAEKGRYTTQPNPMVGCVLVKNDTLIGQGYHEKAAGPHAEINAITQATENTQGAIAYVSLEPCSHTGKTPPCVNALIKAGVSKVIVALQDPNPLVAGQGISALKEAGISVLVGLLQEQAAALNKGFLQRMRTGNPRVLSKIAMSLDGRTAMASGESKWITGEAAREDVHRLRAQSGAVLTGIGTVLEDNPQLTVRKGIDPLADLQPLRVVLDSKLQTPVGSSLTGGAGSCVILTCSQDVEKKFALERTGFVVVVLPVDSNNKLCLQAVMDWLGEQEINDVMVEAGSKLNGALLQAGLIDELIVYLAPAILGDASRGAFNLPDVLALSDKVELDFKGVSTLGDDLKLHYGVVKRKKETGV